MTFKNTILTRSIYSITILLISFEALARAGGGGGGGSGDGLFLILLMPFAIAYAVVINYLLGRKSKQAKEALEKAARDSFWDSDLLSARIEQVYFKVQEAWMERNQDLAREFVSDRLYNKHKMQSDLMIKNDQKNIMENINLTEAKIVEISDCEDDSRDMFRAYITGTMTDYIIDVSSKEIVSGCNESMDIFSEIWKFKREDHGWVLDEINQDVEISELRRMDSFSE